MRLPADVPEPRASVALVNVQPPMLAPHVGTLALCGRPGGVADLPAGVTHATLLRISSASMGYDRNPPRRGGKGLAMRGAGARTTAARFLR